MSKVTQLNLNGILLPQSSHDRYACWEEDLSVQVDMISGRRVKEIRGTVQMISWSYDYMGDELWRELQAVLRSGTSFQVAYLPDDGDELRTGIFLTASLTPPTFGFSVNGKALWHNVAFTLREVRPHD